MMIKLQATRSVLEYNGVATTQETNNPDSGDWVTFTSPPDDGIEYISRELIFRLKDWEDMGRPGQVTVTVEPGDKLNGP